MAWVKMVEEVKDTGQLMEVTAGGVTRVFSLRPQLRIQRDTFSFSMTFGGSGLGRFREELIATAISGVLHCKY